MLNFLPASGGNFVESAWSSGELIRFAGFELDKQSRELRKDGTPIRLQEQPLQMLEILLEQPGKIVTREELRQKIWLLNTFVDFDHGINNAVKRLREALGGYRRNAPFHRNRAKARLPIYRRDRQGACAFQRLGDRLHRCFSFRDSKLRSRHGLSGNRNSREHYT